MKIDVTQEDIDQGQLGHCNRCPVARAVLRVIENKYFISVTAWRITFYNNSRLHDEDIVHREQMPIFAERWIENFDRRIPVVPFSFELDLSWLG